MQRRRRSELVALLEEVFEYCAGRDAVPVRRVVEEGERHGARDASERELIHPLVDGEDDFVEQGEVGVRSGGGRSEGRGRIGDEVERAHRELVPELAIVEADEILVLLRQVGMQGRHRL